MAQPGPTVAVISIGEMGLGLAQLLIAHKYRVITFAADRSESTQQRAWSSGIELCPTIPDLVDRSDYILSIVPPGAAFQTAERIVSSLARRVTARRPPLYFIDLNATSTQTAQDTEALFKETSHAILIDGGIIGGVPYPKSESVEWHCPTLIVSGPTRIPDESLAKILNIDHISDTIGTATGVKMCYAATTKGFVSLAIQSFTTAHRLGVLPELQDLMERYNPSTLRLAEKGLVTMPPKAYRWVHEMREIGDTFAVHGGFDSDLFYGVSKVYQSVAEDTELGNEKPGQRIRGTTVEDVVELMSKGLQKKKEKQNGI